MKVVRYLRELGRSTLRVSGKEILESCSCCVAARLHCTQACGGRHSWPGEGISVGAEARLVEVRMVPGDREPARWPLSWPPPAGRYAQWIACSVERRWLQQAAARTCAAVMVAVLMIWMQGERTRWRLPISWYICSTAPFRVVSRYSLYALWKPVLQQCKQQQYERLRKRRQARHRDRAWPHEAAALTRTRPRPPA